MKSTKALAASMLSEDFMIITGRGVTVVPEDGMTISSGSPLPLAE